MFISAGADYPGGCSIRDTVPSSFAGFYTNKDKRLQFSVSMDSCGLAAKRFYRNAVDILQ